MRRFRLNMKRRHILEGYVFVSPFILGFLAFFAFPLYISLRLSFGKVIRIQGFNIAWAGFDNFVKAFVLDTQFVPMFVDAIKHTLFRMPLIIVFSLLLAILINRDIKFRGFYRVVFFLPFLLGTGHVMQQILGQGLNMSVLAEARSTFIPNELLAYLGPTVGNMVDSFFGIIVEVLWSSGMQILLFLSGLQGISVSLYESAKIDGATEWDSFWKITLPMISPITLLNIIYTIIDSFTNPRNPIVNYIINYAFKNMDYAYGAAMGWIYFVFIMLVILVAFLLTRNYIYSDNVKGVAGK
jgi:ABC-type sugar transport system permease subunit